MGLVMSQTLSLEAAPAPLDTQQNNHPKEGIITTLLGIPITLDMCATYFEKTMLITVGDTMQ